MQTMVQGLRIIEEYIGILLPIIENQLEKNMETTALIV